MNRLNFLIKSAIRSFLEKSELEEIEVGSFIIDYWNIVLQENEIAIADCEGNVYYIPYSTHSKYAMIGYLLCSDSHLGFEQDKLCLR